MGVSNLSCFFILSTLLSASALSQPKFVGCGGSIQANSGSLTYPEAGSTATPGEICTWIIHLQTLQDFRLTFDNFNITSENNANCSTSGIRLYSLTNLVFGPEPESYTYAINKYHPMYKLSIFICGLCITIHMHYRFCDQSPPTNTVFLGRSAIAVIFYAGPDQSANSSSSHFPGKGPRLTHRDPNMSPTLFKVPQEPLNTR